MSDTKVVNDMIAFIEEKERRLQAEKMLGDSSAKNDIIKAILDELERRVSSENK